MTKLPSRELLDGTKVPETTTGEFRLAMGNLRQYLAELLGDEGTDRETARQTLGIDLDKIRSDIASKADGETVMAELAKKADSADLSLVALSGDFNHLVNKPARSDTLEGYGIVADTVPTAGSTRPVTSGGIKTYVDGKVMSIRHGMALFSQSGTFVVPEGVSQLFVMCIGGGGGGGWYHGTGGTGGGSVPARTFASGMWVDTYSYGAGCGGTGSDASSVGGSGGSVAAYVTVTPGETVQVTVGAGGGGTVAGLSGACFVKW